MRKKSATMIQKDYENLTKNFAVLSGMTYHYNSVFEVYLNWTKNLPVIKNLENKYRGFILGSSFTFRDKTGLLLFGGKQYKVYKQSAKKKVEALKRLPHNFITCHGYEQFEKFLKTIASRAIVKNTGSAILIDDRLGFSSQKSCYLFLNSQYRNNEQVLNLLRALIPALNKSFKEKNLGNYLHFYRMLTIARNHIIHSNELIFKDSPKLKNLTVTDEKYLKKFFKIDLGENKSKYLFDTTESAREILESLAEMAYLIITSFDSSFIM